MEKIRLFLRHKYLKIERGGVEMQLPIEAVALIVDMFDSSGITRKQIEEYMYCEREYTIHYEIQGESMDNQLPSVDQVIIRGPKKK